MRDCSADHAVENEFIFCPDRKRFFAAPWETQLALCGFIVRLAIDAVRIRPFVLHNESEGALLSLRGFQ
jgi:hypothetical protein